MKDPPAERETVLIQHCDGLIPCVESLQFDSDSRSVTTSGKRDDSRAAAVRGRAALSWLQQLLQLM